MGFPFDMFVYPPGKSLICSICTEVARDPVILKNCGHLFCKDCITLWIERVDSSKDCPDCRQGPLTPDDFCPTPRVFRQMFNELQVKCRKEGCSSICNLENYEEHFNQCVEVACGQGCGALVVGKDISSHICLEYWKTLAQERDPKELEKVRAELRATSDKLQDSRLKIKKAFKKLLDEMTATKGYLRASLDGGITREKIRELITTPLEITVTFSCASDDFLFLLSSYPKKLYLPIHSLHGVPWSLVVNFSCSTEHIDPGASIKCHDDRKGFSHEAAISIRAKIAGSQNFFAEYVNQSAVFTERSPSQPQGPLSLFRILLKNSPQLKAKNFEIVATIKPKLSFSSFDI